MSDAVEYYKERLARLTVRERDQLMYGSWDHSTDPACRCEDCRSPLTGRDDAFSWSWHALTSPRAETVPPGPVDIDSGDCDPSQKG
jgi:hypothetical protein